MNIETRAILPSSQHLLRVIGHGFGVRRNSLPVECGLAQSALPFPMLAFACKQAVAKKPAAVPNDAVFEKVVVIANQNVFDEIGTIQKVNVDPSRTVVEDVAVFCSPTAEY